MARRRSIWSDTIVNETTADDTQDSADLLVEYQEDESKGMTLVRLIISLNLYPNAFVGNSLNAALMSMGIGIFSREMVDLGDFPEPGVANNIPQTGWMWRDQYVVSENPQPSLVRISLDIRSQRKLMYGLPFLVIDNEDATGMGFTMRVRGVIRALYLLP